MISSIGIKTLVHMEINDLFFGHKRNGTSIIPTIIIIIISLKKHRYYYTETDHLLNND